MIKLFEKIWDRNIDPKWLKMVRTLKEFPWLWGIRNHWSSAQTEEVHISHHLVALRIILRKRPMENQEVWVFTTDIHPTQATFEQSLEDSRFIVNGYLDKIWSNRNESWAEAIMRQIFDRQRIVYLAVVDPCNERDCAPPITIYDGRKEAVLNRMVETLATSLNPNAHWKIDLLDGGDLMHTY